MKIKYTVIILGGLAASLWACNKDHDIGTPGSVQESVVVANRGEGSISFVDANSHQLQGKLSIPNSEPMYVVYSQKTDKVYVGDRANNQVHQIDPQSRLLEKSIAVGKGVFHMWANGTGSELWINNDIDQSISIVDLASFTVSKTLPLGIKPHDVFLTQDGSKAYVSILSAKPEIPDSIYLFNTNTHIKMASRAVGKDPHVFHVSSTNRLLVPSQSGQLFVLDGNTLSELSSTNLTGAHGIYVTADQGNSVVTNISGNQLYLIDNATGKPQGAVLNTPVNTPHNVVINADGNKVFVTHSGPTANMVTYYTLINKELKYTGQVQTGTNHFGLTYLKRQVK